MTRTVERVSTCHDQDRNRQAETTDGVMEEMTVWGGDEAGSAR